ncbi:MAG: DMT family transporter [Hyphomonadaceae bacterium]
MSAVPPEASTLLGGKKMPVRAPSPIVVALACFALACAMDAVIKHVAVKYSPLMIMFVRFAIGAVVAAVIYKAARAKPVQRSGVKFHLLRGVAIVASATTFAYALTLLPFVEAITLGFAAPLMLPFMARLLLKEKLSGVSVAGAVLGFVGVAVATYVPGAGGEIAEHRVLGVALMMAAALTYALQLILLRLRSTADGAITIGLIDNLLPALMLAGPALALAPLPKAEDLHWFVLIGAVGAVFWVGLTWAYGRADAQTLAPLEYTTLLWSSLWGWLVFHEPLRAQVYAGAVLIIGACALVAWDQQRRGLPSAIVDPDGPLP